MSTDELLADLEELLNVEVEARDLYSSYLGKISDSSISSQLSTIYNDEVWHIKAIGTLIDLVKAERPEDHLVKEGLSDFAYTLPAVLISTSVENYFRTNLTVLKHLIDEKGLSSIYVTVNKSSSSLLQAFKREGIDVDKIYFVDCTTTTKDERRIFVSASNLTDISIAIGDWIEKISEDKFVYFDAISTLYIFNPSDSVERFVHFLIPKLKNSKVGLLLVAIRDEMKKKSLDMLTTFCDSVIQL